MKIRQSNLSSLMNNRSPANNKQQGVALLVVLLLLAVMTAIAATMSERLVLSVDRASNQVNNQQAYWYAIGVEALARYGIEQSHEDGDTINLSQPWAIEEQTYPLEYGDARGAIRDMQACFNVNSLAAIQLDATSSSRPYLLEVWRTLLEEAGLDNYQAEVVADSTWEYLDDNDVVTTQSGVEDATYEGLSPAYMAPNSLIADLSELRSVYQMDASSMRNISWLACALPTDDLRINVNTIRPWQAKLLVALFDSAISEEQAKQVLEDRPYDGWESTADFLAEPDIASVSDDVKTQANQYLSVDSHYFELDVEVFVQDARVRLRSLLYSENKDESRVVRRRFGGISERNPDSSAQ
ncbi:general secretion pathway protein GspK [Vibrio sp. UCD-FRSSP16_10]|uniref:type II secretion system minor pseudopilin GspK n=1 Tax=unclassified Vibrio TaxID=2614977 RepID=UPI0007FCDFC6|nr:MULTISPECIES: type II secretion system minor pseudopilin GspK [unclassified Vibrio]OBT10141.1 general secretion pathway protein GspK [Vibrio sp. UCD-FRSSP16_30]OBT18931.1 general secretion pathway protein GspK [Vibrio sp. UCD-FRSSP16_10]